MNKENPDIQAIGSWAWQSRYLGLGGLGLGTQADNENSWTPSYWQLGLAM